jgi:hypothetical protein
MVSFEMSIGASRFSNEFSVCDEETWDEIKYQDSPMSSIYNWSKTSR